MNKEELIAKLQELHDHIPADIYEDETSDLLEVLNQDRTAKSFLENDVNTAKKNLDGINDLIAKYPDNATKLSEASTKLQSSIDEYQKSLDNCNNSIDANNAMYNTSASYLHDYSEALIDDLKNDEITVEEAQANLNGFLESNSDISLKSYTELLNKGLTDKQSRKLTKIDRQISSIDSEMAEINDKLANDGYKYTNDQIEDITDDIDSSIDEIQNLTKANKDAISEITNLNGEISSMDNQTSLLNEQIASYTAQLDSMVDLPIQEVKDLLSKQIEDSKAELDNIAADKTAKLAQLSNLEITADKKNLKDKVAVIKANIKTDKALLKNGIDVTAKKEAEERLDELQELKEELVNEKNSIAYDYVSALENIVSSNEINKNKDKKEEEKIVETPSKADVIPEKEDKNNELTEAEMKNMDNILGDTSLEGKEEQKENNEYEVAGYKDASDKLTAQNGNKLDEIKATLAKKGKDFANYWKKHAVQLGIIVGLVTALGVTGLHLANSNANNVAPIESVTVEKVSDNNIDKEDSVDNYNGEIPDVSYPDTRYQKSNDSTKGDTKESGVTDKNKQKGTSKGTDTGTSKSTKTGSKTTSSTKGNGSSNSNASGSGNPEIDNPESNNPKIISQVTEPVGGGEQAPIQTEKDVHATTPDPSASQGQPGTSYTTITGGQQIDSTTTPSEVSENQPNTDGGTIVNSSDSATDTTQNNTPSSSNDSNSKVIGSSNDSNFKVEVIGDNVELPGNAVYDLKTNTVTLQPDETLNASDTTTTNENSSIMEVPVTEVDKQNLTSSDYTLAGLGTEEQVNALDNAKLKEVLAALQQEETPQEETPQVETTETQTFAR